MIKQALKQPYDQRSIPICKRAQYLFDDAIHLREVQMAWSTPKLKEINCGMEINEANDRIVDVYGTDKITPLFHIIKRDQKNQAYPWIGPILGREQRFNPRIIVNTN